MSVLSSAALIAVAEASPTPTPEVQLDGEQGAWTLAAVVFFVLAAGVLTLIARILLEGRPQTGGGDDANPDRTTIRAWLAISLVGGLLIFAAASFWFDDTTLRSTLIGGVIANAGAAVAFYFASKASDQARRDILNAALPTTVVVPDLVGKDLTGAEAEIAKLHLTLVALPPEPPAEAKITSQAPLPGTSAHAGSTVAVMLEK